MECENFQFDRLSRWRFNLISRTTQKWNFAFLIYVQKQKKKQQQQNCILKEAILESHSLKDDLEKFVVGKTILSIVAQCIASLHATHTHFCLFLLVHPPTLIVAKKPWSFSLKSPTFFPLEKIVLRLCPTHPYRKKIQRKKKVKMVLVVVAKMVPKMNRWGESY